MHVIRPALLLLSCLSLLPPAAPAQQHASGVMPGSAAAPGSAVLRTSDPARARDTPRPAPAEGTHQVVGYFPQWGVYNRRYVPKDLITSGAVRTLTQIDYAQAGINNAACTIADPQADLNLAYKAEDSIDGAADAPDGPTGRTLRGNLHQLQLLHARYPKLKLVISIEGKRSAFEDAGTAANRVAFVHSCVARFLEGHLAPGVEAPRLFDGIDVDWEYPDADHAADYVATLEEFRRQMNALRPGLILAIASGAQQKTIDAVDWKRAGAAVDQVGVMTYDYNGPWSHTAGLNAPLYTANPHDESVSATMAGYLDAGVPPAKLLLGLPFYAYQWHGVPAGTTNGMNGRGDAVRGNLNQSTATALLANPAAKLYRDPASEAPWIYDGDNFLTFEDPVSLRAKTAYVRDTRLGGVMIWELSGDSADGQLLQALRPAAQR